MSRDDWERAKRQGRLAYVGWRVAPLAIVVVVAAIVGRQTSEENWFLVLLAPLVVLLAITSWGGVYDRSRRNYEDTDRP